ncbi:MAG: hypothetical protein AB1730_19245 [Myxococcota bacterium]|jgi:hypothetical protein
MAERLAVTMAIRRPDGSVEHVQVGTAVRSGDGFTVTLEPMQVGGAAPAGASRPAGGSRTSAPRAAGGGSGMVFPPYGRSKGMPIEGASMADLEFYARGCRRTLDDPSKARWHDKERQLLAAIEAEIARQQGGGGDDDVPPPTDADAPPPGDDDAPF